MGLIYHYTRFETFMSYILPSGFLKTNSLKHMNDPRESLDWAFGGINVPYESVFEGYYSDKTHFDCQYKFGNMIKNHYQVVCFSGANEKGWNNEMMWAHYGGLHSGICLEFDEERLTKAIASKYPGARFKIENINYKDDIEAPWLNWERSMSFEENMDTNLHNIYQSVTLNKSSFWEREDERRLVFINSEKAFYIPIEEALKTVYVGVKFNNRELLPMMYKLLHPRFKLSMLIYQHNKFERWGIKQNDKEEIGTCDFENL